NAIGHARKIVLIESLSWLMRVVVDAIDRDFGLGSGCDGAISVGRHSAEQRIQPASEPRFLVHYSYVLNKLQASNILISQAGRIVASAGAADNRALAPGRRAGRSAPRGTLELLPHWPGE